MLQEAPKTEDQETKRQGLLPTPPLPDNLPAVELTDNARQV